jgi:hypothetical protein
MLPETCKYVIHPSSIGKFFNYPRVWYEENILGEKKFLGNTATELGNVCHTVYDAYIKGETPDVDSLIDAIDNPEVDKEEMRRYYPEITSVVINEYLQHTPKGMAKTEYPVSAHIMESVYIDGTCDCIIGDTVIDYKTVSVKPNDLVMPFDHKIQLMAYAYALRQMGTPIERIRLVYGIKPTKTLPARCLVVNQQINSHDWQLIDNTLKLMAESMLAIEKDPKLIHLIFKSMALKVS